MKKIFNLLFISLAVALYSSCSPEEEDLFDQSSANRVEAAIKADKEVLTSATNGWLMEYYPSSTQQYGGYTILVSFTNDGNVTVASDVYSANETVTSTYVLKQSAGIILSFDTYNPIMHFFSDPANPAGIGTNGKGMEGDFEFNIMEASKEKVVMLGRKTQSKIVMTPIADGRNWEDIINEVQRAEKLMNATKYELQIDGDVVPVTTSYRTLTFTYGEEGGSRSETASYIVTSTGYTFYAPVEIKGVSIEGFTYDSTNDSFTAINVPSIKLIKASPALNELLVTGQWYFHRENMNQSTQALWDTGYEKLLTKGWELYYAYIGIEPKFGNMFGFCFGAIKDMEAQSYEGTLLTYTYQFEGDNEITLILDGQSTQTGIDFYDNGLKNIISFVEGTFTIVADDPSDPTLLQLTNKANPDIQFILANQEINFPHYSE